MSHIEQDKKVLIELEAELDGLHGDDLKNGQAYIEELRMEVALAERVRSAFEERLDKASRLSNGAGSASKNEQKRTHLTSVDFSKIGWVNHEESKELEAEVVHAGELRYLFIDLTDFSNVTKKLKNRLTLQSLDTDQGEASFIDKLYLKLKQETIPQRHDNMIHGRNMRVVNAGYPIQDSKNNLGRTFKTSYHTTKENLYGTNNRAIVMHLGNDPSNGLPIYALAAMYDHDDDRGVHQAMCWSQK